MAVFLQNGGLQLGYVKISVDTALGQKFINIDFSLAEILFKKFSVVQQEGWFPGNDSP